MRLRCRSGCVCELSDIDYLSTCDGWSLVEARQIAQTCRAARVLIVVRISPAAIRIRDCCQGEIRGS